MINCGMPPTRVGVFNLEPVEFMYYLYMPISMKGSAGIYIPDRLIFLNPLLVAVCADCDWVSKYIYITAKSMFVNSTCIGNRPGWHIDGFQSNGDINYIWYDANPTEFAIQDFVNIPDDDAASMAEFERQAKSITQYPINTLLRLDESVVHRATPDAESCFRTFIKITISDHKLRNFGNSKNYLIDYNWENKPRKIQARNLDHG